MYQAKELAVLHAVATPYRERSHFDAQKVLEAGGLSPSTNDGGWLNRALAELQREGGERDAIARRSTSGLSRIAGSTWSMPIFAVLRTPHTTFFMSTSDRPSAASPR